MIKPLNQSGKNIRKRSVQNEKLTDNHRTFY